MDVVSCGGVFFLIFDEVHFSGGLMISISIGVGDHQKGIAGLHGDIMTLMKTIINSPGYN